MRKFTLSCLAAGLFTVTAAMAADPVGNTGPGSPAGVNVNNSNLVAPSSKDLNTNARSGGNSAATMNEKATGARSIGIRSTGSGSNSGYQNDPGSGVNNNTGGR